ncbi:MAG TPA: Qat anti-phage system TatD family nuclease QatD [Polyangia bacterium]|nr:Qat anti-phage system TatD family nuclease QatD [Polyangia bacterium]
MSAVYVDFHCHVDLYPDHAAVIAECDRENIYTLAVTTTPKAWPRNRELASSSRRVQVALGLHPQLVAERADELTLWREYLSEARYVGEVGLDAGARFYRSLDLQKQVFAAVLRACAEQGGKLLTVHSVRATKAVLDLIEAHLPPARGQVVLHWFTGTRAEARRAVDLGCYFSVNAEMLRGHRHDALVAELPLNRVLTETDGPFTKMGERTMRPADVTGVVSMLAKARRLEPTAMAETIAANLRTLVSGPA